MGTVFVIPHDTMTRKEALQAGEKWGSSFGPGRNLLL